MGKIKYIKDGNGQIVGQERDNWLVQNGKQVARYDKGINRTRTADAKFVGVGDQRLTQLGKRKA